MQVNVTRLRYWFAAAAIAVVIVVAGFYLYARYRIYRTVAEIPQKLGVEVQQSTEAISLSKSEGGRTLFTIRASKAVQLKEGGRAELHDVNIVVYGHESNRYDQIYGSDFQYDPRSGNAVAEGKVYIDLQTNSVGMVLPNGAPPPELKNPIHLETSGLVFNRDSGQAKTDELVEFSISQANGSAVGATYDSKTNSLVLASNVHLEVKGPNAATVSASHGVITKEPRRAVLDAVRVDRNASTMSADKVTLFLREDNSIEHVHAEGNVQTTAKGATSMMARAPEADFFMNDKNLLRSAVMKGGVAMDSAGEHALTGNAGKVTMEFGADAKLAKVRASDGVKLLQMPGARRRASGATLVTAAMKSGRARSSTQTGTNAQQSIELTANAVDFYVRGGRILERAETSGASQFVIAPKNKPGKTVVTAAKFVAAFDNNRLSSVHGAPQARVVQSAPGEPDKVSTSDTLDATMNREGGIAWLVQEGHFRYSEGQSGAKIDRNAWAEKATYRGTDQVLLLTGSPRVTDGGMTLTADDIQLHRVGGDLEAHSNVKTTYSNLQPQPNGAPLASAEPVHVTSEHALFQRSAATARYAGDARLWQGANVIQAPVITFDRGKRSVEAQAVAKSRVSTMLVQQDAKSGKLTPVSITANRFDYTDMSRKASFEGDVMVRSADGTVSANQVDVFLKASNSRPPLTGKGAAAADNAAASRVDRIVAKGHVVLQQPTRRGTGERLVYTAGDGKFVLTGGPPSIFDAERGTVTGASLTFYSRDDRVLVESGESGRSVTTTRVSK